jgi:hypothetical protein
MVCDGMCQIRRRDDPVDVAVLHYQNPMNVAAHHEECSRLDGAVWWKRLDFTRHHIGYGGCLEACAPLPKGNLFFGRFHFCDMDQEIARREYSYDLAGVGYRSATYVTLG